MTEIADVLRTAVALGVAYAIIGGAVSIVGAATRSLFLSVGVIASAGLTAALALGATSVTGINGPLALLATTVAAAAVGALFAPVVLARRSENEWLVGFVVAAGVLEGLVARTFGGRTVRPDPLLSLGSLDAVAVAVIVGVPVMALLAWLLSRTPWGHRVRIVGSSPAAAEAAGLRVLGTQASALALAASVSVVAATLVAPVVSLGPAQSAGLTVRGLAAALLLGRQGPMWAIPGGLLLGLAEAAGQRWWPASGGEVVVAALVLTVLAVRGAEAARGWGRAW